MTIDWANLSWTCHGCGSERPDAAISVLSESVPLGATGGSMSLNLRYCNDRPECAGVVAEKAAAWKAEMGAR
jgi:hypothetical protein